MNRDQLAATLQQNGIRRDAYQLGAGPADEAYILDRENGQWVVYYSERGLKRGLTSFEDETAACTHLLTLLQDDLSTRV